MLQLSATQLRPLALCTQSSTDMAAKESVAADKKLSIADLNDVYNECFKYRASWNDIGLVLGLDDSDLEAIKKDSHYVSEECLCKILSFWLRQDSARHLGDLHKAINQISPGW